MKTIAIAFICYTILAALVVAFYRSLARHNENL